MLAVPWDAPFSDPDWCFELKWDGVRCLAAVTSDGVTLRSRMGNDVSSRYPEIAGLDLPGGVVLDGEVVALDERGHPSFERLQGRMSLPQNPPGQAPLPVTYVVFDLLHDGESLVGNPLSERADRLAGLELPDQIVKGDRFENSEAVWDFVIANDLEGIVAKRLASRYEGGRRSPDWRKIGYFKQVRAIVGGYTAGTGGRTSTFGSLLLGLADGDRLRWIGAVGSGFSDGSLRAIRTALDEMAIDESPFRADAGMPSGCTWVEPQLVAMVRYKQWTAAGRVRAPSFKGFTDTPLDAVTWAVEGPGA